MATLKANQSNGYDKAQLTDIVGQIEGCLSALLSERGAYMKTCQGIRERIANIYDEAKDAGIPRKELKALIKTRELERKIQKMIEDMEADSQQTYEMLVEALGDFANTPLGGAAMERAKPKGETRDSLQQ